MGFKCLPEGPDCSVGRWGAAATAAKTTNKIIKDFMIRDLNSSSS